MCLIHCPKTTNRAVSDNMRDLFWLTEAQLERLRPFFPKTRGIPGVNDRRVLSGIIFVNRNGLRWRDAPAEYGPHKTLCNRWKRWSRLGVFVRMLEGLAAESGSDGMLMVDATHPEVHRTAAGLRLKRGDPEDGSDGQRAV